MDSLQASRIAGGNSMTGRRQSDLYPTPPEVTVALMRFLNFPSGVSVWEPAAGDGDMSDVISQYAFPVYVTDIRNGTDFLKSCIDDADWIITNPPFSLAEEFIRHAAELNKPFAMLLKAQYWHAAKRAKLFEELPPSYILPLTWRPDFFFKERDGKKSGSPLMDVMWCVCLTPWMKNVQTVYQPLPRPERNKNHAETE